MGTINVLMAEKQLFYFSREKMYLKVSVEK
jgi:hypothetical protein